ncbi:MAG TPA: cysteine--tRNA ligase [Gammaproteobacteria bacterium]|nr:cysteine--tRNA ligase [Acidiferrobacteraceae bacterium]MDP6552396.1 cysteine--tRNA ligase [Arenicellales bacterium]MDP6790316.1 cysteine--tRNA ligase [Arenicellales bacterium]MDP6918210.1 cysteine--tRNA ligase [Arenicellales bacterium]HCX88711.1 cysteine--tRNA ligase [Gammaproteobacteria bacterium]|tara:strand:+ start:8869 stop:10317 length:1449 start_codon:yes stop_codon:yes gene_type:complete
MAIRIYNSLTRKKEVFQPLKPGHVGMYVCGMTVYDYCHLGHARVLVVFDMVVRVLRAWGHKVEYVRNITDIDDKIIARAAELSEPFEDLTERFIGAMHEDERILNVAPPDKEPRATGHINEIISMTCKLEEQGLAYQGNNGDVYFRVRQFENYGHLSGRSLDEMKAGARVDKDESKDDPLDFVLWKHAKPGEPQWPSPWGDGRPGWHIECSAMSTRCLGDHFDIHGGGMDLRFPHHENEIAQTEGATAKKFVNIWMHNGFVQIDEEKMSKSLGNFFTIRDIVSKDVNQVRAGEAIRFLILLSHYRSPLNFSDAVLDQAQIGLERLYSALFKVAEDGSQPQLESVPEVHDYAQEFDAALEDDFNTPSAIAVLFDIVKGINRALETGRSATAYALSEQLKILGGRLGLLYQDPGVMLGAGGAFAESSNTGEDEGNQVIEALIQSRNQARQEKDFEKSDDIRAKLEALRVILEDRPDGSTFWRRR